jgi:AraC-like DNA-binding protein
MTQTGEQLTPKGEFNLHKDSTFAFHKNIAVSYGINLEDRKKIEIVVCNPGERDRSTYQMVFVLKGNLRFLRKKGNVCFGKIGNRQHNLCKVSYNSTKLILDDPADEVICINLTEPFLKRYLPEDHYVHTHFNSGEGTVMLSPLNMQLTPDISSILLRLSNLQSSNPYEQLLLESRVIELMALQMSQYEHLQLHESSVSIKKEEEERMYEARDILVNHNGEQLSLRSLAHMVGTNEFNLKRDFKAVFGMTVYKYLSQHKMEQAKTMIVSTDISIAEISQKIGYKHATHFTNAFKKYFGYLPNKIKSGKLSLLFFIEDYYTFLGNFEFGML